MSVIINAGVCGNNTRALLARMDVDILSHRPDLILLMVGTNDALNSAALVPIEEYRANLAMLVTRALATDCQVLLATIAPFHLPSLLSRHQPESYGLLSPLDRHHLVNGAIRDCAKEYQLPVADVNTALSAPGYIGDEAASLLRNPANSGVVDGVHPTAEGYALIAALFYRLILDHNLPVSKIVCFGDSITFGTAMRGEGTSTGATYPGRLAALLSGDTALPNTVRSDE